MNIQYGQYVNGVLQKRFLAFEPIIKANNETQLTEIT